MIQDDATAKQVLIVLLMPEEAHRLLTVKIADDRKVRLGNGLTTTFGSDFASTSAAAGSTVNRVS
jgi:hypothetical protein